MADDDKPTIGPAPERSSVAQIRAHLTPKEKSRKDSGIYKALTSQVNDNPSQAALGAAHPLVARLLSEGVGDLAKGAGAGLLDSTTGAAAANATRDIRDRTWIPKDKALSSLVTGRDGRVDKFRATPIGVAEIPAEAVERIREDLDGSLAGGLGYYAAKWITEIGGVYGAWSLPANMAVRGLTAAAAKTAPSLPTKIMAANNFAGRRARDWAHLAAREGDAAGAAALNATQQRLGERLTRGAGGAAGIGAYEALGEYGDTDFNDPESIASLPARAKGSAIMGAVIAGGLDISMMGLGRLFINMHGPDHLRKIVASASGNKMLQRAQAEVTALQEGGKTPAELAARMVKAEKAADLEVNRVKQMLEFEKDGWIGQIPKRIQGKKPARPHIKNKKPDFSARADVDTRKRALGVANRRVAKIQQLTNRIETDSYILGQVGSMDDLNPYDIATDEAWSPAKSRAFLERMLLSATGHGDMKEGAWIGDKLREKRAEQMLRKFGKTIEDWRGKLGVSGTKIVNRIIQGEGEVAIRHNANKHMIQKWVDGLAKSTKLGKGGATDDGKWAREIFDMAEDPKLGIKAVRAKYGKQAADIMDEIDWWTRQQYDEIVKMGGEAAMVPSDYGVARYFSHVMKPQSRETVHKHMVADKKLELAKKWNSKARMEKGEKPITDETLGIWAEDQVALIGHTTTSHGVWKMGSIDERRAFPGTLKEKMERNPELWEDNPWVAMSRYYDAVSRRISYGKWMGIDGELEEPLKRIAVAEGADEAILNEIMGVFTAKKAHDETWRQIAQTVTNVQILGKLPFATILNTTQFSNIALVNGMGNMIRPLYKSARGMDKHRFAVAANANENIFQAERRVELGGPIGGAWLDRAVNRMFQINMFSPVEYRNRIWGAASTGHQILNDIGRGMNGRIRGIQLDATRRRFHKLNLDYDQVVNRYKGGGGLTQMEMDVAVHRGAQASQFMPDLIRKPTQWTTPLGRVMTQFNSFALGQWNMMRKYVLEEAAHGNYEPMASMMVLYPMTGEVSGTMLEVVKGRKRPKNQVLRIVDNMSLVGGLGMGQAVIDSAKYGRLDEMVLGPMISDGLELTTGLGQIIMNQSPDMLANQIATEPINQAIYRAGLFGGAVIGSAHHLMELSEMLESEDRESSMTPTKTITLSELQARTKGSDKQSLQKNIIKRAITPQGGMVNAKKKAPYYVPSGKKTP